MASFSTLKSSWVKSSIFQTVGILFVLLSGNTSLMGQSLVQSRTTSYYTYLYKITDAEAKPIYRKKVPKIDAAYFHTLIDSFPTDSLYLQKLKPGHYLKTLARGNEQFTSIQTVQNIQVYALNNYTDLCLQLFDLKGNIISNAQLKIKGKKLRYDNDTRCYIDRKSNKRGLLCVQYNGYTSYFDLNRRYNNSTLKRSTRTVVYGTPIKYAWIPVRYATHLPIDGFRSIKNGSTQGTLRRTVNFFVHSFEKVACLFDAYYCDNYRFSKKLDGYWVFNKPKYLPNDTLRFKTYLTKKGKPLNQKLKVILRDGRKHNLLGEIEPYRKKGGYAFQFHLHDSLNLALDRNYTICLKDRRGRTLKSSHFAYEDYELSKNQLTLRTPSETHYQGKGYRLFASGTDENGLNLLDGRLEVLVTPLKIDRFFENTMFVPDTLWVQKTKLNPEGETEIVVPDSVIPHINCTYKLEVALITSDNERISKNKVIRYYFAQKDFDISLKADSIVFTYKENGQEIKKEVRIYASDVYHNKTKIFAGHTPCTLTLDPLIAHYTIGSDSLEKSFSVHSQPALVRCYSQRTPDSVFFQVDNPRNLDLNYNIYKLNREKCRGFADSLNYQAPTRGKQNYWVSLQYIWGGKVTEENYAIPLADKKLHVEVEQPQRIFPGQKANITIQVTDNKGNPVPNVDLTAMGLTKKFGYSPPGVPHYPTKRKNKRVINSFSIEKPGSQSPISSRLDYEAWRSRTDSISYYKFLYPGNAMYSESMFTPDSITQFSPFVVNRGRLLPVHVIYVDGVPVYFSWASNKQPYAFRTSPGYHQVKLRTARYNIVLDSVSFDWKKKTIFSVDVQAQNSLIRVTEAQPKLSAYEKQVLYRYIFPYRKNFGRNYVYIKNGQNVQCLNPSYSKYGKMLAGPVNGKITLQVADSFQTTFRHEPYFEYDFSPSLLKMRQTSFDFLSEKNLYAYGKIQPLGDVVLTEKHIEAQWQAFLNNQRYKMAKYQYPRSTSNNFGKLCIKRVFEKNTPDTLPLNLLVFRYDDPGFFRIYPGKTSLIHALKEGYHRLIYFYPDSKYQIEDSVYIQPNGLNYYAVHQSKAFKKDSFSIFVDHLLEENLFKAQAYPGADYPEVNTIYESYQREFSYTGPGQIVNGTVVDKETGEALPGVNVNIPGTTYGCVTDLNGQFQLNVPLGLNHLLFRYLGFEEKEIAIDGNSGLNVSLEPDISLLEEVVVVGYGSAKKYCLTGSVATVQAYSLLSAPPGIHASITEALPGQVCGLEVSFKKSVQSITIRGAGTTNFDTPPLIILDGNIFLGDVSGLNPNLIKNVQILKSTEAMAIYGSKASGGVILIHTKEGVMQAAQPIGQKETGFDRTFFEAASKANAIRSNFSDAAFWQPALVTNAEGKASFTVTFPDDVTNWETHVWAMNGKRQSGQTSGSIPSYKPVMAQLSVPRFMIASDSAYAIGKVRNYMPGSIRLSSTFETNNTKGATTALEVTHSHIDTLPLTSDNDSVKVKYTLKTVGGYVDGEQRTIPVFRKGLEETYGNLYVLHSDTTLLLKSDTSMGPVTLYAVAHALDVVEQALNKLVQYKYNCNEQMASKLRALLAEKAMVTCQGEKFKSGKKAERFIRLLLHNQNADGLWGWWGKSVTRYWISRFVLETLMDAHENGFRVNLDTQKITASLLWEWNHTESVHQKIDILSMLHRMNPEINYTTYLKSVTPKTLSDHAQLSELKQSHHLPIPLDSLMGYQKTTLFGSIYFSNENEGFHVRSNDVLHTLAMYRVLRNDSTTPKSTLQKIRNYFYEQFNSGNGLNTYTSALLIKTLLPDLLTEGGYRVQTKIDITGDIQKTVTAFPFELKFDPTQNVTLTKQGNGPVYLTTYQKYWNTSPDSKAGNFEIETRIENCENHTLQAGKPVTLVCNLTVKKDAEYVLINVPIPGGCSYASKGAALYPETHREYFKNETSLFCEKLPKGTYLFHIELLPRFTGSYTLNPAKVELMYFPVLNANNGLKRIRIE